MSLFFVHLSKKLTWVGWSVRTTEPQILSECCVSNQVSAKLATISSNFLSPALSCWVISYFQIVSAVVWADSKVVSYLVPRNSLDTFHNILFRSQRVKGEILKFTRTWSKPLVFRSRAAEAESWAVWCSHARVKFCCCRHCGRPPTPVPAPQIVLLSGD